MGVYLKTKRTLKSVLEMKLQVDNIVIDRKVSSVILFMIFHLCSTLARFVSLAVRTERVPRVVCQICQLFEYLADRSKAFLITPILRQELVVLRGLYDKYRGFQFNVPKHLLDRPDFRGDPRYYEDSVAKLNLGVISEAISTMESELAEYSIPTHFVLSAKESAFAAADELTIKFGR